MRILVVILIVTGGCSRDRGSPSVRAEAAAKVAAGSAVGAKHVDPSRELSPLVARLAHEAKHRSPSPVSAERVLDALAAADFAVVTRTQYLGLTVRANYCAGGATSDGLVIAVCEYPDVAAAEAGKAFMHERFSAMTPAAKRATHGPTVLTIVDPATPATPARDARVQRALEVFAAL